MRETKNANMFRVLDAISICVLGYVVLTNNECQQPFLHWYYANAAWSLVSFSYLSWFVER